MSFIPGTMIRMSDGSEKRIEDLDQDDKVLSLIQTTLICCRVAHYLKVQIRELLGSFVSANECEQHLSKWLSKYVSNVSSANDETCIFSKPTPR